MIQIQLPLASLTFYEFQSDPLPDLYGHFQAPASFRRFLPPCIVHPGARPAIKRAPVARVDANAPVSGFLRLLSLNKRPS